MSIGTSLALSTDCPADVDTNLATFALRAADIDYSEYAVAGLTLPTEQVLTVSHETRKNGVVGHRVQISYSVPDSNGVVGNVKVSLLIAREPNTAITNALILQFVNSLVDFMIEGGANANVTKVLNREV